MENRYSLPVSCGNAQAKVSSMQEKKGQVAEMEEGRRKIRLCLMSIVLAAVATGIFYYYYSSTDKIPGSEGTLIRKPGAEYYVC